MYNSRWTLIESYVNGAYYLENAAIFEVFYQIHMYYRFRNWRIPLDSQTHDPQDYVINVLKRGCFSFSKSKLGEAVDYLHKNHPELIIDGELQADFALNSEMLNKKFPFSKLANKKVNTLIFPNLDAANITYKMLKELDKVVSIGPIMMGLEKPVHIFQLGASVEEMVNMAAVAVVDAQEKLRNKLKVKSKK